MSFEQIAAAPDSDVPARVKLEFSRFITALACIDSEKKEGDVTYVKKFRKDLQSDDQLRKKVIEYIEHLLRDQNLRKLNEFVMFAQFLISNDEFTESCIEQSYVDEFLEPFENAAEAARAEAEAARAEAEAARAERRSMCAIS